MITCSECLSSMTAPDFMIKIMPVRIFPCRHYFFVFTPYKVPLESPYSEEAKIMNHADIQMLREKGYGYKRIANELGLSVNTVKSYCRRHPELIKKTFVCLNCGKPFEQKPKRKQKRFCSDKCRYSWWNKQDTRNKGKAASSCLFCGREFYIYRSKKQKFCSRECYHKFRGGV